MNDLILAIDTSCDETSAAITKGKKILSNVISSQISIHKKYGGVFPTLAKRAHEEKIDFVIKEALARASRRIHSDSERIYTDIVAVAVTQGPGLAIALEVGIKKAKELCLRGFSFRNQKLEPKNRLPSFFISDLKLTNHPKLIAVNHLEGHIYSCLAQNLAGKPEKEISFPALCLIVSGGHTQLVLMKDHGIYETIGTTLDDACGEALDKAAKILKLGYPGGPIIEKLAEQSLASQGETSRGYFFNQPLKEKANLNFSYSGLKTQLLYLVQNMSDEEFGKNLYQLAASFQHVCFEQIIRKTSQAIKIYQPKMLLCGGGVIANKYLRNLLRKLSRCNNLPVLFPPNKNLSTDNAAMIGVAAWYKFQRKEFVEDIENLDREPRLSL